MSMLSKPMVSTLAVMLSVGVVGVRRSAGPSRARWVIESAGGAVQWARVTIGKVAGSTAKGAIRPR